MPQLDLGCPIPLNTIPLTLERNHGAEVKPLKHIK